MPLLVVFFLTLQCRRQLCFPHPRPGWSVHEQAIYYLEQGSEKQALLADREDVPLLVLNRSKSPRLYLL